MWKSSHFNSLPKPVLIGIRREDPKRIWERRAPLTPDAVHNLISSASAAVEVVSCSRRFFADAEYEKAGARIVNTLSKPNFVLGVKEPPLDQLDRLLSHDELSQTHLMFSHTVKGQDYNMPLLARFLKQKQSIGPRLIDFELLKNEEGKRMVGFGWFAGAAGVLEAFSAMSQYHLEKGIGSPFLYTSRPYMHRSLNDMRKNLQTLKAMILDQGIPDLLGPFIVGLTGTGNVAQGAMDMLKELPLTSILPEELVALTQSREYNRRTVYLLHAKPADYLQRLDKKPYGRKDYYSNPHLYESVFHEKIAPYLSLFINGVGWAPNFPRLMSNDQLFFARQKASHFGGYRLTNIADISCDVKGGLEFLTKATTISSPFYDIDCSTLPSVRMMAVDILPASMPLDASKHFSSALEPYLMELIHEFRTGEPGRHSAAIKQATIVDNGKLTKDHRWLQQLAAPYLKNTSKGDSIAGVLGDYSQQTPTDVPSHVAVDNTQESAKKFKKINQKNILLLGSGMVAQPAVDFLVCKYGAKLMIASNNSDELDKLAKPYSDGVETMNVDFSKPENYEALIRLADVVISLLPANMHHEVAKVCILARKPLVTASYKSPEMSQLDFLAQEKGILILTEMGLDPGLDHLSAAYLIDRLVSNKHRPLSFVSMCGGLPSPEDAHGIPLKYKFSWRPQGVLVAALQDAFYVLLGEYHEIRGDKLLENYWNRVPVTPAFDLEGLPNRNSLNYAKLYRLEGMRTFVRGTLRYPGYSSLLHSFKKLGLLSDKKPIYLQDWNTFVRQSMLVEYESEDGYIPSLPEVIPVAQLQSLHDALEWLGLATSTPDYSPFKNQMPPLPRDPETPLSIFAYLLSEKLRYAPNDKDMVVLSHEIITDDFYLNKGFDGRRREQAHTSTLIAYGTDKMNVGFQGERPASAMARTVGFPAAIAAMLIAEGKIQLTGVRQPAEREIYQPVLKELEEMGIVMEENSRRVVRDRSELPNTIEGALGLAVASEEKKRKWKMGAVEDAWNLDLDYDQGWKEEESVEWAKEARNAH